VTKRTTTKPGLGSNRPPKTSKRPAPITVPSLPKQQTPSSRVGHGTVPKLTPNAGTRKDKKIEPSDAFLLSRIDGQLKADELADLTGMSERDVIASLKRLVKAGLVTIA
jgi:hypothetical protein